MAGKIQLGQVVQSKAGRDEGIYYVVIGLEKDFSFVYLADGNRRKVEKPKKKNPRHLCRLSSVIEDIRAKSRAGMRITNKEVAQALEKVREKDQNKGV